MNSFWMIMISSCLLLWAGKGRSQQLINLSPVDSLGADHHHSIWQILSRTIAEKLDDQSDVRYDALSAVQTIFSALKSSAFPTAVAKNISQQCLEDSQLYVRNLYANRSLWALQSKSLLSPLINCDILYSLIAKHEII